MSDCYLFKEVIENNFRTFRLHLCQPITEQTETDRKQLARVVVVVARSVEARAERPNETRCRHALASLPEQQRLLDA